MSSGKVPDRLHKAWYAQSLFHAKLKLKNLKDRAEAHLKLGVNKALIA